MGETALMPIPLDTKQVTAGMAKHYQPHQNLVVPNCCSGIKWEADLFVVRPSGWAEEVEVKVSKADFRREFQTKAWKHRVLQEGEPTSHSTHPLNGNYRAHDPLDPLQKPTLTSYEGLVCRFDDWGAKQHIPVKRFWYAMPAELADDLLPEIPTYAGLYKVSEGAWGPSVLVVKEAPKIAYCRKITDAERLHILRSCYYRWWDVKRELATLKAEVRRG